MANKVETVTVEEEVKQEGLLRRFRKFFVVNCKYSGNEKSDKLADLIFFIQSLICAFFFCVFVYYIFDNLMANAVYKGRSEEVDKLLSSCNAFLFVNVVVVIALLLIRVCILLFAKNLKEVTYGVNLGMNVFKLIYKYVRILLPIGLLVYNANIVTDQFVKNSIDTFAVVVCIIALVYYGFSVLFETFSFVIFVKNKGKAGKGSGLFNMEKLKQRYKELREDLKK